MFGARGLALCGGAAQDDLYCPDPLLLPLPRTPSQAVGPQLLSPMLSIDCESIAPLPQIPIVY